MVDIMALAINLLLTMESQIHKSALPNPALERNIIRPFPSSVLRLL